MKLEDTVQKWWDAVLLNDRITVSTLLKTYPEYLHYKNSSGQAAVYYASHYGSDTVLSFLLSSGANINVQEKNAGWTPLIVASNEGFDECVSLLIEAHAHLDIRDIDGCTALICAASNGHTNIVSSLLKAGANVYLNDGTWNALHYSIYMGKFEITSLLLDYGMDINDLFF